MLNNPGEIKALIELIEDPDENVFKSITDRFIGLGKEVVPIIKEQLDFTADELTIEKINHIIHKVNFNLLEDEMMRWNNSPQKSLLDVVLALSIFIDQEADKNEVLFEIEKVKTFIKRDLDPLYQGQYEIQVVPNIVNITYGRDVGYKIEQESFDSSITDISATNIRKSMGLE